MSVGGSKLNAYFLLHQDNLDITVTKTCLDVLQQLGNAFSSAMESTDKNTTQKAAPYVLKNETGLALVLDLESSNFKVSMMKRFF